MARLTIVPTPIGNLQDITLRALSVLQSVDLVLAEDTRTSSVLMKHFEIEKPMESLHKFNEYKNCEHLIERISKRDLWVALISDAGTPGINDPGTLLVRECITEGISVECLPGPTAFVPAIVASGLSTERFCYEGFLPVKKGRQTRLAELTKEERTIIVYESPHRILRTLKDLISVMGEERKAAVCREISKKFEEYIRGSLKKLLKHFEEHSPKGEFVLVIEGATFKRKTKEKDLDTYNNQTEEVL